MRANADSEKKFGLPDFRNVSNRNESNGFSVARTVAAIEWKDGDCRINLPPQHLMDAYRAFGTATAYVGLPRFDKAAIEEVRAAEKTYVRLRVTGYSPFVAFIAVFCYVGDWDEISSGNPFIGPAPVYLQYEHLPHIIDSIQKGIETLNPQDLWNPIIARRALFTAAYDASLEGDSKRMASILEEAALLKAPKK